MAENSEILNALTIDVEDYFQVSNFERIIKNDGWDKYESRVADNTLKILDALSLTGVKATFFILGWTAERYPELVKKIDSLGHEIASHGYSHRLVYKQSMGEFKNDLIRSIKILEGITGKKVLGFRAASCSITKETLWAFDILKELGIKYDASIFPVYHDRYGIPEAERFLHRWNGNGLVEFPFSTVKILGKNLPVAGGGYFRLYPYLLTKWAIRKINQEGHPAMVYVHPWEFDAGQPKIQTNPINSFRHYINIGKNEDKLKRLLDDFNFTSISEILRLKGLLN